MLDLHLETVKYEFFLIFFWIYAICEYKLVEKYNALAKEALTTGDRILSENYLQHVDHFVRIIDDRNRNREQNKISSLNKSPEDKNSTPENNTVKHEEINNTEE